MEMEHLVGDPTFVKRKQNPPAERGKFEEANQINQEVIRRQRQDSREVVDKVGDLEGLSHRLKGTGCQC